MGAWRFLDTGAASGPTNMAVDAAILAGVNRGTSPPTVRVYAWDPPAVSTGHAQDLSAELDLEACVRSGVGVVRRPTGGRAVLHAGELTYSVIGESGEPPLGASIMETYGAIAEALVKGLGLLGVSAELAAVQTAHRGSGGGASPPCFVSAGRFEIVVGGRKLVGSAQRRVGGGVLQHGSLLIDERHEDLADFLRIGDVQRDAIRKALRLKTTTLSRLLGRAVEFGEVAYAVRRGFEDAWGIMFTEGSLTDDESEGSRRLATEYGVAS